MSGKPTVFDVALVGGGPAGAASAITLSRLGRRVVLLEESRYDTLRVGETVPPSIRPLLHELGIWPAFQSLAPVPSYGTQSAWGGSGLASRSFIFSPLGAGWHLDRQRFDAMLADSAAQVGTRVFLGAKVQACTREQGVGWQLSVASQDDVGEQPLANCFYARAVIDATGRKSELSRRIGARRDVYDHMVGVAVQFEGRTDSAGGFTLVEAAREGWWYSAPLPRTRMIVILMTDADLSARHRRLQIAEWLESLRSTEHTANRCREYTPVQGPRVFSAVSHRLRRATSAGRWLAVGDAAMGVDPLSSSGVSRALRTGRDAAKAIDQWLAGDRSARDNYENALDKEFVEYLQHRRDYYALETRWPDAPFWQRRTGDAIVVL